MNRLCILLLTFFAASTAFAGGEPVKIKEVVVSATRYEESLASVPANTSIISKEEIRNSTAHNIPDLLREAAGMHVNDIAGNKRNLTVDMRGFGETAPLNTLVLVDGRPVNQADLSGTDWSQIPLDRVQKIEIVRGGRGSVMYGDNAGGGVINIITKEGEGLKAGAGAAAGSYDTYKGNVYFSNSTDNVTFAVDGRYLNANGYRDNSDTEARDIGGNVKYYISDLLRLNFSTGYHKDKTGLPGALKDSDFASGASRTNTVNPLDYADVEDYYFKGGPEIYFWEDSFVKLDASYRKRNSLSFASFVGGSFTGGTEIITTSFSPQALLRNRIGEAENSLTLGYDYQKAKEDIENNSSYSGLAYIDLEKKSEGYYAHDELRLFDKVILSGGYRHDRTRMRFRPSTPSETTMDEDLYTAGINIHFYKQSYTYASYSRSFRNPVLDELFNFISNTIDTSLIPQTADNYEIGLRHYFNDDTYAQVNVFRIDTSNEILYNPAGGSFGYGANENLDGKTRRDGVEFSFGVKPVEQVRVNGSYTYLDASVKGGQYVDKDIPNVPSHKATLNSVFSPGHGFTVALNGVYIGKRQFISDFTNSFPEQEDYLVVNSKIQYQWKNVTVYLDLNNITNEEYSEFGTLSLFSFPVEKAVYPSPKFNMLFGVSVEI